MEGNSDLFSVGGTSVNNESDLIFATYSLGPDLVSNSTTVASILLGKMIFMGERDENETDVWAVTRKSLTTSSTIERSVKGTAGFLNVASSMAASVMGESFDGIADINNSQEDAFSELVGQVNGTISDMNPSYWPIRDPLYITVPITAIYVIILILGLMGNVVTCIVIVRSRYLHTATNYYLFSLAVSDLLLLLSGLPAEMHSIWRRYPDVFGEAFCVGRGLAAETSSNATVLTITAFTIERYLAICRPFMIQKWQNKLSRVVRQILVIWAVSVVLAIPQALQFGLDTIHVGPDKTAIVCTVKKVLIEHSFEIATFVFFVGPMILITGLYCMIGYTLRNSSRVGKESKIRLRKSLSGHKREVGQQRVLKMLVAICIAFFVCWAPFHAQRLIAIWGTRFLDHNQALRITYHILTYISGILYYVSTCINPILYSVMSLKFRHAFQENVNKCCGDQVQRKPKGDIVLQLNQRSVSHSGHSSHSRSQNNNMVHLTEVTMSQVNGNPIQTHVHQTGNNLHMKYEGCSEAVDI